MTKYKINKGFIVQKLGKKTVIFEGEKSVLYTFNDTATFIFQKLKLGWEQNRIIESLIKTYGVKKERVVKDFKEIINELIDKKIVIRE